MVVNFLSSYTASKILPKRNKYSNKGDFGKVLLICGSKNMVGCCVLATGGALRSGAGIVTTAFPDILYNTLTSRLTENLFLPLKTNEDGFISKDSVSLVVQEAQKSDAVMIGCGIGVGYAQTLLTVSLIKNITKPLILDADALNCLGPNINSLKEAKCPILITPHPGEMARLTGKSIAEIERDRQGAAIDFCKQYNVNLLLKGHNTIICNSVADSIYINKTGNTGLSKGGSGDLLSGIIAGLVPSLEGDLFKSAALGAFIHGLSADMLKKDYSEYSILPSDCLNNLPKVFSYIEESGYYKGY